MIVVCLPGQPRAKGRPRFSSTGVVYTPAETRKYESALARAGQAAMAGKDVLTGPLMVEVLAGVPIPKSWEPKKRDDAAAGRLHPDRRPDCDNILKTIDALNNIVWQDDAQICLAIVRKIYTDNPRLEVRVSKLGDNNV